MDQPTDNPFCDMSAGEVTELVEHLANYALSKMRRLSWRGIRFVGSSAKRGEISAGGGISPVDLAAEAIELFLEGKRKWNQEKVPDFRRFLRGIIDSRVSHLVEEAENRATREAPVTAAAHAGSSSLETLIPARGLDGWSPAEVFENEEWKEKFHALVAKEIDEDPLLHGLIQCFGAGLTPAEAAEMLEVEVNEIYNARKRLARKLNKVEAKQARSTKL